MTREHATPESTRPSRRVLLRRLVVLLGGAVAFAGRAASSQGKPPAETANPAPFKADSAFAAVVSVEAYYVTATQAIQQITPPDFPHALRVAPFDAETPLHLCVKNKSLGEVLQTCATLLNGQWREEKATNSSPTVYILEPKPDTVSCEKALYLATLDLNAEPLVQTARLAARHSLNYWQKQYQKVKTVPPTQGEPSVDKRLLQFMAQPDGHGYAFWILFAGLPRIQRRTLVSNGCLVLPWSMMNATQRQSVLASRHIEIRIAPHSADYMTPEQNRIAEQKERDSVQRFGVILSVDKAPISGQIVFCRLAMGTDEGRAEVRVPDTDSHFLLPVRGNPYHFDIDTVATNDESPTGTPGRSKASVEVVGNANEATIENLPFPPAVRFAETDIWADVVQTLAQKLPFAIVSDAYTAARLCKFPLWNDKVTIPGDLNKMTAAQALDALCTAHNYLWWHEPGKGDTKDDTPGTLFFRSRAWFVEKRYEPPAWAAVKATATLQGLTKRWESVTVVDSVVGLTIEQLQGVAARKRATPYGNIDSVLMNAFMQGSGWNSACSAFYWLRFWSHLTPEQKQLMKSPAGLTGSTLDEVQKNELLQGLFASSSLQVPPSEVNAALWEKARLHVWYSESSAQNFSLDNTPQWRPNELRPASLTFTIAGAETAYGSRFALPIALAQPPQPKKTDPAKVTP